MVVGFLFNHWRVPVLLPAYLLLLTAAGACYYTHLLNTTVVKPDQLARLTWARRWPKPLFSLFLYEVVAKKRLPYLIAKLASVATIAGLALAFPASRADVRLLGLMGLCCAVGHAVLVFQANEFELFYLSFARNLPYERGQLAGQQILLYGALLLPELAWLPSWGREPAAERRAAAARAALPHRPAHGNLLAAGFQRVHWAAAGQFIWPDSVAGPR
jgi:hypothetical protein